MAVAPAKPNRHLLRFSVRTLLIALTIFCVWLGWKVERARKQREAVAWVHQMGGSVHYDYELDGQGKLLPNAEPPGPKWLNEWLGIDFFNEVVWVSLYRTQVRDVSPLAGLKSLRKLNLRFTQVKELAPLAGLARLENLYVKQTQVVDISPLSGLTSLEWLDVEETLVTDLWPLTGLAHLEGLDLVDTLVKDIAPLAGLPRLEVVLLSGTPVSDVSPLSGLTGLQRLYLGRTPVTEEAVEELQAALPQCKIVWSPAIQ